VEFYSKKHKELEALNGTIRKLQRNCAVEISRRDREIARQHQLVDSLWVHVGEQKKEIHLLNKIINDIE